MNTKTKTSLWVGTSGYSYTEWKDAGFYPENTRSAGMLAEYAGHFMATELNFTWYQMPKAASLERMAGQVPQGFVFAAKLTRTMTHEVEPGEWKKQVKLYRQGVGPLVRARQLAAVLAQFPPGFRRTPENRKYLALLLDELSGLPVAVEFRHASWAHDRVFSELARRNVALAAIDAPQVPGMFPSLDVVTSSDLFYLRLHGRNAVGWRSGNMQKQFDYDYTDAELAPWVDDRIPRMLDMAEKGLVFFNNHVRAQAPKNARQLIEKLVLAGIMGQ